MASYFSTHYKDIFYSQDSEHNNGLRNAQLGAIHAIASFFTLQPKRAGIVVMPTGAGKTAVLMMAPYILSQEKVLVVTPSIMVRGQITEDFQNLSTLRKANVFEKELISPKVYEMEHKFKENIISELDNADVIVASPQCALSLSETQWARNNITLVEIDEAHHSPAKTWQQILINLDDAKHILYTATPFRLDKKELQGEIIFDYPLSMAYRDGIFGEIQFIPVQAEKERDVVLAKKAEEIFLMDREAGLQHFLMVRTNSKENAKYLEDIYRQKTSLNLKRIDSSMTNSQVKQCITELKNHMLDGIICVDMLGEGFDFPNLKIAAIHSPHKSLASTLQFIGRFARTNAKNIGSAKFVAINDEELEIENNQLYASDSIWQEMIINMSEGKNQKEAAIRNYYKEYDSSEYTFNEDRLSLHSISVNCHDKVYHVKGFNLYADFPASLNIGNRIYRNKDDNTVIGIGLDYVAPKWMNGDNKINKEYSLYIIHYQASTRLLHIYSQVHTEILYEKLAKSFCESFEKIPKSDINRVLGNLNNFEIFNSGFVNRYAESGESYRISAGSDISDTIDPSSGKMYSAGHIFCKAIDSSTGNDKDITIGYSSASKIWSSAYVNIWDYISWVDELGKKIINSKIKVKTNTNYDFIPIPTKLSEYPDNLFFADYNEATYSSPPIIRSKLDAKLMLRLTDFTLNIINFSKNQVTFTVQTNNYSDIFTCDIQGNYKSKNSEFIIKIGKDEYSLSDYFDNYPISFKTTDDTLISGIEMYHGISDGVVFNPETIKPIEWSEYNTDETMEFGTAINSNKKSIHETLREILLSNAENKYVIYDHGSGEIADFLTVSEKNDQLTIHIYHVKKKSGKEYNSSVADVYEIAGQAVKSIIWFSTKGRFSDKLNQRHQAGYCKLLRGDFSELLRDIRNPMTHLQVIVVIVQPAISKGKPMPQKIQEILAAANSYISRAGKVQRLEIMGSK